MKLYQIRRHYYWHIRSLIVMFLLPISLLVGCGQSAGGPNMLPASTVVPTSPPLPTSTLPGPDIDVTKIAQTRAERQEVDELSTRTAMGTPWVFTPVPYNTSPPNPTPILGFGSWCTDPDPYNIWRSCWTGIHSGEYIFVYAGASKQDPEQGVVQVYTATIELSSQRSPRQRYMTPTRSGLIHIVEVVDPDLILEAENGSRFHFDLTSHQWVASTPIPSPSP